MLDSYQSGTMNEADTCRTCVLPKLKSAGWEDKYISEQMMLPSMLRPQGGRLRESYEET